MQFLKLAAAVPLQSQPLRTVNTEKEIKYFVFYICLMSFLKFFSRAPTFGRR